MQNKKPPSRGVVDSIAALRLQRYMTRGPGAARARKPPPKPSTEQLREKVDALAKKKPKKKKAKRTSR